MFCCSNETELAVSIQRDECSSVSLWRGTSLDCQFAIIIVTIVIIVIIIIVIFIVIVINIT